MFCLKVECSVRNDYVYSFWRTGGCAHADSDDRILLDQLVMDSIVDSVQAGIIIEAEPERLLEAVAGAAWQPEMRDSEVDLYICFSFKKTD